MESETDELIINQCLECRQDLDVTELSPFSKIVCPYCSASVRVRTRLSQYEIQSMLGEGGMSQVFLADDLTLGRKVALKILHQSLTRDEKLTQMFEREAKLTASINHPNVVKVFTVGSDQGYFYIAMELVDAVSVEQMLANDGALPEKQVLNIAYDVVCGLRAAYQENLIHRDIKPGNMLVTKDGTAKLVDFGLAVAQGVADDSEDLWATPFYVPPEKLVREPDTHLGDIYALGATCFHALAGQPPFAANTSSLEDLIEIKAQGVDLKTAAPNTSKETVKLVQQMMSYDGGDRPSSYDELLKQIETCQGDKKFRRSSGKSKKSGLIKLAIGVGVAGILVFAGLKIAGLKNKSDLDSLLGGSGERVISAEERGAARKMLAGRDAMVKGRLQEALGIFRSLEGNKNFSQPSLAWNTFSHGLVELLLENETKARETFSQLTKQSGFDGEKLKPYGDFFHQLGATLSDPLPVLRSDLSPSPDSFQSIGLLAAGLKNWEHGEFAEASRFFSDFAKVDRPASDPWIGNLKSNIEPYQSDYLLFKRLPNPSSQMPKAELKEVRLKLRSGLSSLKTSGKMKQVIGARITRADQFIAAADNPAPKPVPPPPDPNTEWTEAELSELEQLQTRVDGFKEYRTTYLFTGAVLKLESVSMTTPNGKALRDDLIEGYRYADGFISGLVERLNLGNYSGIVRRKEGDPLDAAITKATETVLTVDLGFGPTDVEIEEFDPRWLIEASEKTLGAPSGENVESRKETFWFAIACGLKEESNRLVGEVAQGDPFFKTSISRIAKIEFGLQ